MHFENGTSKGGKGKRHTKKLSISRSFKCFRSWEKASLWRSRCAPHSEIIPNCVSALAHNTRTDHGELPHQKHSTLRKTNRFQRFAFLLVMSQMIGNEKMHQSSLFSGQWTSCSKKNLWLWFDTSLKTITFFSYRQRCTAEYLEKISFSIISISCVYTLCTFFYIRINSFLKPCRNLHMNRTCIHVKRMWRKEGQHKYPSATVSHKESQRKRCTDIEREMGKK